MASVNGGPGGDKKVVKGWGVRTLMVRSTNGVIRKLKVCF